MYSNFMKFVRKVIVRLGKKHVTVKTVCCMCESDLHKDFHADMTQNISAKRQFITYGKVESHGYCTSCYNSFMESQLKDYKAALKRVAA